MPEMPTPLNPPMDNADSHLSDTLVEMIFYADDFLWGSNSLEDVIHELQEFDALLTEFDSQKVGDRLN